MLLPLKSFSLLASLSDEKEKLQIDIIYLQMLTLFTATALA